jgi:hypothetical protein
VRLAATSDDVVGPRTQAQTRGMTLKLLAGAAMALALPGGVHQRRVPLRPMPEGSVVLARAHASVSAIGLTPGSTHVVELRANGMLTRIGKLTADDGGRASGSLMTRRLPRGGRIVLTLGTGAAGAQPIAQTAPLDGSASYPLKALGVGSGHATFDYDASAQTLRVTVDATGLTPGAHAAHIHNGSCERQGSVQYMLPDLVAGSDGTIVNQVRVLTGVTSDPGPGLYLNIHQGDGMSILANGMPTLAFRPLLCADL